MLVIFMVPGHLIATEFERMRTRSYHSTERTKEMQVAVPAGLSSPAELRDSLVWMFSEAPARRADGAATA